MSLTPYQQPLDHLHGAMQVLNLRLHRRVLTWRAEHHADATSGELAGLYTSDAGLNHLINRLYPAQQPAAPAPITLLNRLIEQQERTHRAREAATRAAGADDVLRLPLLAERLALSAFEQHVLTLALAAECDRRYERIFGYLNDDLTQRLPTPALAGDLFYQAETGRLASMPVFASDAPLRALRLIRLHDPQTTPLAGCSFRLDEALVAFLLAGSYDDARLHDLVTLQRTPFEATVLEADLLDALSGAAALATAYPDLPLVVNLHGTDAPRRRAAAGYLASTLASPLVVVAGPALVAAPDPDDAVARVRRQALLLGGTIAIQHPGGQLPQCLWAGLRNVGRLTLLLTDAAWYDPEHPVDIPVIRVPVPAPDTHVRQLLWRFELGALPVDGDLVELADRYRLDSGQIAAAASSIRARAGASPGGPVPSGQLFAVCREHLDRELGRFARCIETPYSWDDLILPPAVKAQLSGLEAWVRHRHTVLQQWQLGRKTATHGGLAALFSGPSGTGKTLSAAILGRHLGLDVYRIDLSALVSKYIGETEKNLERIFDLAVAANAILFFDEADALFGKRSEVQDAHDRYANIEVSYLLQRMETYPGIAILTTNFKQNIDQAFLRRFQAMIEFPFPQPEERELLWRSMLPPEAPCSPDVDLGFLARQFPLTGGNIKNCVLFAAYSAASTHTPIGMEHLISAIARELEKLEQPVLRSEFGRFYDLVRPLAPEPAHVEARR